MTTNGQNRPFRDRLLDGFDRSRIRRELNRVRRTRVRSMSRRYATMVFGASLAVGGVGIPLSIMEGTPGSATSGNSAGMLSPTHMLIHGTDHTPKLSAADITAELESMRDDVREEVFRSEVPFGSIILEHAKNNSLAPELVAAVVETESQYRPNAKSPVGARGLMQLMPKTGYWMGAKNLTDPEQNVQAGTKYLRYLNERFKGDPTKVIAAYNAGEGNVRKFGGVPPFKETRNYVVKVNKNQEKLADQIDALVDERLEQKRLEMTR